MITFSVKNQTLVLTSKIKVVADSQDYLYAQFTFTDDWNDTIKLAQFTRGEQRFRLALDQQNKVKVPWEVLKGRGKFQVTVTGNNQAGADNKVITTNPVTIRISESGLVNGEVMEESTAGLEGGVLNQILGKASEALASAENAAASERDALSHKNAAADSERVATEKATAAHDDAAEALRLKNLAEEAASQAVAIATQLSDVLNAPRFYYDENGHLMFSYGSSGNQEGG